MPLLPPQPFGPPERCYPLTGPVERYGVTQNKYGEGFAVHVPWLPGQLFYRQGHVNTLWFLRYVFEKLLHMRPVGGSIPPTAEVTLLKNADETYRLFHLVNNNGHFGNTFYEPTPVSDIQCRIPLQTAPSSVVSLTEGGTPEYCWEQGTLRVQIKCLRSFEALLIR